MPERASQRGWAFEQFLFHLLVRMPGVTGVDTDLANLGLDLVARTEDRPILVEAKAQTPQTVRRLQGPIDQILAAAQKYTNEHPGQPAPRLVIAFPGVLTPGREAPAHAAGIELWNGPVLQRLARSAGIDAPPFLATPDGEEPAEERDPVDELLRRLAAITPGKSGWPGFERFCEDLLNLLFCPPLSPVVTQLSTENGVNRRDFILPNYATEDFWAFVRVHYRGDFIVAEAKNYADPVRKNDVLQLANYLTHHGTGLVGLMLTRQGLARDAAWTSREQWLLHDKLIIGLNDEDYQQMLLSRRAGGDPSDLVRQRVEDFRLRI